MQEWEREREGEAEKEGEEEWRGGWMSPTSLIFSFFLSLLLFSSKTEPPKNVWRQATLTGFVKSCVTTKPKKDNNEADEAKNSTEAKNRTDEDTNTTREDKKEDGNTNEDRSTDSTIYPTTNNQNNKTKDKQLSKGMKKVIASAKKQNINNNNVAKNIKTK